MPEQETVARAQRDAREGGGSGPGHLYYQKVTTMWGALRVQVYGFLQTTLDTHGGYEVVRVSVQTPTEKDNSEN